MSRGRPTKSIIRQNIVEILFFMKKGYGYEIYKVYKALYPKCTQKSIYYHLSKGCDTKEFQVAEIKKETGNYSWGSTVERIFYELGENANPTMDERARKYFAKKS